MPIFLNARSLHSCGAFEMIRTAALPSFILATGRKLPPKQKQGNSKATLSDCKKELQAILAEEVGLDYQMNLSFYFQQKFCCPNLVC